MRFGYRNIRYNSGCFGFILWEKGFCLYLTFLCITHYKTEGERARALHNQSICNIRFNVGQQSAPCDVRCEVQTTIQRRYWLEMLLQSNFGLVWYSPLSSLHRGFFLNMTDLNQTLSVSKDFVWFYRVEGKRKNSAIGGFLVNMVFCIVITMFFLNKMAKIFQLFFRLAVGPQKPLEKVVSSTDVLQ